MGKRTCSDMETADESVQKDVQPEQHEEAQPKRKAKGFDLVSGGVNKQVRCFVICGTTSRYYTPDPGTRWAGMQLKP